MANQKSSSRAVIMDLLKSKFGGFSFWKEIEADLAVMCADLPEPTTEDKKKIFIDQLKNIKIFLTDRDVAERELDFIDEEIERHEETRQISLYVESDDEVEEETIDRFSRIGVGTEGVVGIHLPYNFRQLKKLTNGVYQRTKLIKFYISRERTIYGKIVAEIYEHPQKIPIAALIESKKLNKETDEPEYRGIILFGEKFEGRAFNKIKQIEMPFYVYRFISESNQEFILITTERCEIGDYIVTGVVTECDDYKMLTDSARLPTRLPYIFTHTIKNRIIKFKHHKEFDSRLKFLGITNDLFEFPFSIKAGNHKRILMHPEWFKWLMWAWFTHQKKGMFNNYPLHILMLGPPSSGKSIMLNTFHETSKEGRKIFSGSQSTLKNLVPSFKYNPARLGYLAESNRFSFCDEFLRCMLNTKTTKEGSNREESVAMMNDLLEHQKREAGSGVSRVNVNMTSRVVATSNPIRDIRGVEDLIKMFDESFMSRWLIYYQSKDHIEMIRKSRDSDLELFQAKLTSNDWVSILDYLHTFSAKYDMKRVMKIYNSIPEVLSETLDKHYDARHKHHIECLIDGLVKTRCLLERDMNFTATEEDYERLADVWLHVIRSWVNPDMIRKAPVEKRIYYLPEKCQYLYRKINEEARPMFVSQIQELVEKGMTSKELNEALIILIDMGVVTEHQGTIKPHYMAEIINDTKQSRLSGREEDEEVVQGEEE